MHLLFNKKLYTNITDRYFVFDYSEGTIYLMPDIGSDNGVAIHTIKHPRVYELSKEHDGQETVNYITEQLYNYLLQKVSGKALDPKTGQVVDIPISTIINMDSIIDHIQLKQESDNEIDLEATEGPLEEPEESTEEVESLLDA